MKRFKTFFFESENSGKYNADEMAVANATSRARGAIGAKAITPRYVETIATPDHTILDYGAGSQAAHAERLRGAGLQVTAHEFGSNQNERHDPKALSRQYGIVYASNVLNTQSSTEMMTRTLDEIRAAVQPGGGFVGNFPMSPRKSGMTAADVEAMLRARFANVRRVGGTRQAPLWHAHD
jgi:hypothetical protein